jgi:uncharacterized protein (TIGR03066 family)
MRTLSALGLAVLLCVAGGAFARQDDNAKKIVGTWEVTKSEVPALTGAVVEFTKDNKLVITVKAKDKEVKVEGTYKVEKDKLMTKITFNNKTEEDTDDIVKLTDDALELRDKDKKVTTFKKKK